MDPVIAKGILTIVWGIIVGFFIGLTIKNYYEIKLHRKTISKLIDEVEHLTIEKEARKLADRITSLLFGDDKPEDLEKAIEDLANESGVTVGKIVIHGEKEPVKKTTKKATKKADKKEKK